jgi:hypothetical protein
MSKIKGWTKIIDAPTKNGNGSTTYHKWRYDALLNSKQGAPFVEIDDSESHGYAGGYVILVTMNRQMPKIIAGKRTMQDALDFAIAYMEVGRVS